MKLAEHIEELGGVGPKHAALFAKLSILTIEDLLHFYPRDYIDLSKPYEVATAPFEQYCAVKATVYAKAAPMRVKSGKKLFKVSAGDDTAGLTLTFFNSPYAANALLEGVSYLFYGKVGGTLLSREMAAPQVFPLSGETVFMPVYHETAGLNSKYLAKCVKSAFNALDEPVPDPIPIELRAAYRLPEKAVCLKMLHFPASMQEVRAARRRMCYEELLTLQLGLTLLRSQTRRETGALFAQADPKAFFVALPFSPTHAQKRAVGELCADFLSGLPMNRLLQGDVGSGKTLVAAAGMAMAAQNGYQSVLMAPTEILARQHAATLGSMLAPLHITVALLTGSVKGKARTQLLQSVKNGEAQVLVGTHAVIGEQVHFKRLGFAVTDEQHRFGVRQRGLLFEKGQAPHLLVMSATPIPRTLALLMYGDLDISVLDELPPGRTPVKTYAVGTGMRARMYHFLSERLQEGRQAYIVCPLIEESENTPEGLQPVTEYLEQVAKPLLPGVNIALLHGKMKPAEKNDVMSRFVHGEVQVLCSTTVIEVGVDVPNATIMIIENAERYGLSALHQLRGRVGRGRYQSYCILVSDHNTPEAKDRLHFLCHTPDGFEVAKYDLETRGPGDFFGSRQHGLPALKIASLEQDGRILYTAQQDAHKLLAADARLARHPVLKAAVERLFAGSFSLN